MELNLVSQKIKKVKYYTIELVEANPSCVFVFGDNLRSIGTGGQATIRYCKNSHGIPTKVAPTNSPEAFFNDKNYESNCSYIKKAIDSIPKNYETIVFPEDGLGTGLAKLPEKAPRTYNFMINYLNSKFGNIY